MTLFEYIVATVFLLLVAYNLVAAMAALVLKLLPGGKGWRYGTLFRMRFGQKHRNLEFKRI